MIIEELAQKTLQEIKKSKKEPYPLYYKEVFNLLAKQENLNLNPILMMENDKNISNEFLDKTKQTVEFIEETNKDIQNDSKNFVQEIAIKSTDDEILNLVRGFEEELLNIIKKSNEKIEELNTELENVYKQLHIDTLTKAYNRKALEEDLNKLEKAGQNRELNDILVVFDVDHFKTINDTYGHLVGDFVLKKIVSIVKEIIRNEDRIYRFGGDEFIIIFNRIDKNFVNKIAEKIRYTIEHKKLKYKDNIIDITLSIGVACHHKGDTKEDWLNRADLALYESKETRNKVTIKC